MANAAVKDSLGVVSLVATLGVFLPSIEHAWDSNPDDAEAKHRIRRGEQMYLTVALVLAALAAYGEGSVVPLLLGLGLAAVVVCMYEQARCHEPR